LAERYSDCYKATALKLANPQQNSLYNIMFV
jgi:hypothetical protein